MKIKKSKVNIMLLLSAAFAVFSLATVLYYIIFPSPAFLHADCTDSVLWAKASVDARALFNPDFGYAALLPFGGTTIMIPFVAIFGYSLTAHQAGMLAFTILFALSVWFLCRSIEFDYSLSCLSVGTLLLVLASSKKLREIFYEHTIYYSICVVVICVLLGIVARMQEKKNLSALLIIGILFSALSAFDGMQIIATGILPVFFAGAVYILAEKRKIFSPENRSLIFALLCISAGTLFGFVLLEALTANISAGYANAYSTYSDIDGWVGNALKLPVHWLELFGVDAEKGMPIFSLASIVNIIRIGSALLTALVPLASIFLYKKMSRGAKLIALAHFGLTGVVIFGYIFGLLSAANWRLSPLVCTGLISSFAVLNNFKKEITHKRLIAGFCAIMILMSGVSAAVIYKMPRNGEELNERYGITQYLIEHGLRKGYATFWNSQVITLLSNSQVEVANIDVNENGIAPCPYQTDKKMFEEKQGEEVYFVLLTQDEIEVLRESPDYESFKSLIRSSVLTEYDYTIFLFDSTQMLN